METSVLVAIIAATIFSVMTLIRLVPALMGKGSWPLLLVHTLMAAVLWIMVPAVYLPVDQFLGGRNLLNLLQHSFITSVMFGALGTAVARGGIQQPELGRRIWRGWGLVAFVLGVGGVIVAFFCIDAPYSAMGMNPFLDQPATGFYKGFTFVYSAYVCGSLIAPTIKKARETEDSLARRSLEVMAVGLGLVLVLTPIYFGIVLAGNGLQKIIDLVLYSATLLILGGLTGLFVYARRLSTKQYR